MLKKMTVIFVAVAGVIGLSDLSFSAFRGEEKQLRQGHQQLAHAEHKKEAAAEKKIASSEGKRAEGAGNAICPVSGDKIDDQAKLTYEYKGKIYAFCCEGCIEEFKKDPERYIERMERGSVEGDQEQSPRKEPHSH